MRRGTAPAGRPRQLIDKALILICISLGTSGHQAFYSKPLIRVMDVDGLEGLVFCDFVHGGVSYSCFETHLPQLLTRLLKMHPKTMGASARCALFSHTSTV